MPDENEIPANENEIGYTSEDLKNIFEKYDVTESLLNVLYVPQPSGQVLPNKIAITKEEVGRLFTEKENFAENYEVLRKKN